MPTPDLEIFLKLDGIDGESTVKGHEKEITVLSYEQVMDVTVIHTAGGSAAAGKANVSGVRFRKNVDVASIPMLLACASGQHIKEARFAFRRDAGGFDFYKVTLEDVLLTHIAQRAGTGAQYPLSFEALNTGALSDGFLDEVTFNFARIRWEHRAQGQDGTVGTTTSGGLGRDGEQEALKHIRRLTRLSRSATMNGPRHSIRKQHTRLCGSQGRCCLGETGSTAEAANVSNRVAERRRLPAKSGHVTGAPL